MLRSLVVAVPLVLATSLSFAQEFPVSIDHAYGTATIEAQPVRVVTWGWGIQDTVLELDVVPVGMPIMTYGADGDGILDWTREALERLGGEGPTLLGDSAQEPNFEAIAMLEPDVILAQYSGITEEDYKRLSQIAPTIAFPKVRWTASWQEVMTMTGAALGKPAEAAAIVAETEQFIADEVAKYPQIAGKTVVNFVDGGDGAVSIRKSIDPRTQLLLSMGLVAAPEPEGLDPAVFNYKLSYENFTTIDADILVAFMDSPEEASAFFAQPYAARAPQVEKGAYAVIDGAKVSMAVGGAVTPLSLRWALPELVASIGAAAKAAETP